MPAYEYHTEPVPVLMEKGSSEAGSGHAVQLQRLATQKASDGWELHRTDTFDVGVSMGCLAFGQREEREYVLATFRRARS